MFWSAGLGWPKPKRPVAGGAGAAAGVAVEAGVTAAPPNKPPAEAGVAVMFPNRPPPVGTTAGVLPVALLVVVFALFPYPNRPGPVAAGVVEGVLPPKGPPAG